MHYPSHLLTPELIGCIDSDESSVSSSFDVREYVLPKEQPLNYLPHQRRRRVQFDENANVIHENTSYFLEETQGCWFEKSEYKRFRSDYSITSGEISASDRFNFHSRSYHKVAHRIYEAFCAPESTNSHPSEQDLKAFDIAASCDPHRVGLERSIILSVKKDKYSRRHLLTHTVLDIQDNSALSDEHKADMIRFASQEITRPHRLFAQHLAKARVPKMREESREEKGRRSPYSIE